ncbi:hypothetical protein CPB84DRAFT_179767 [Gymnopilus junonius]|uniref:Uncharacterized protein n=1 Tax=Gymnopilus junonius TaxID=109634 RepID=A0A9P5NGP7_GYMJU|nr:hypothetical protein CPB84DRAFT_179767 [Gymnopilus junonius]
MPANRRIRCVLVCVPRSQAPVLQSLMGFYQNQCLLADSRELEDIHYLIVAVIQLIQVEALQCNYQEDEQRTRITVKEKVH